MDDEKVKILAVGGYGQLIANMTAIVYDKNLLIIDTGKGFKVPKNLRTLTPEIVGSLRSVEPKFHLLDRYLKMGYKIKGLFITHCHADHLGGYEQLVKYLQQSHLIDIKDLTVYTTDYTNCFANRSLRYWDKDRVIVVKDQTKHSLNDNNYFNGFLLNHSSLHSLGLYFYIKNRKILFLPDHRTDYTTSFGPSQLKIDQTLQRINNTRPDVLILEGTQISSDYQVSTHTEKAVEDSLRNIICFKASSNALKTVVVSTYGTNPERLAAILKIAKDLNRKVFLLGRGMKIGYQAARDVGLIEPSFDQIVDKSNNISNVNKNKGKYFVLTTGHMGEHKAGLSKMLRGEVPFVWSKNDLVLVCSKTIPKEGPMLCRSFLKSNLLSKRIEFYDGDSTPSIHSSGHITYKDFHKYFVTMDKVKKVIINHGDLSQTLGLYKILEEAKEDNQSLKSQNFMILKDGELYAL